ncbi:MAG: hypothetical protein QG673_1155 [Pseudomonadota bacterium]|nr:hypothetical protein [Pseudomonadota bacterium]
MEDIGFTMYKIKLSPYAKTFYNEWLLSTDSSRYNMVIVQVLYGALDIQRLKNALIRYVKERVVLNSHIEIINDEPHWVPNSIIRELEYVDVTQTKDEILSYVKRQFNLLHEGTYRFKVIKLDINEYLFINVYHHIAVDGLSANSGVYEAISNYYNYPDYVEEFSITQQIELLNNLTNQLTSNLDKNHIQYKYFWETKLRNIDSINLRFLKNNSDLTIKGTYKVEEIRFAFTKAELDQLSCILRKNAITPYIYSMCIFAIILYKYTNQVSLAISYPISIKEGTSYIFGAQVNTNLIPFHFTKHTTIIDLFRQSRDFFKSIRQHGVNYGYYPIQNIMQLTDKRLLDVNFIQTKLRDKKFEFNGIFKVEIVNEFTIDSVVQLGDNDYNRPLFFEQELQNGQLNYRIRYEKGIFDPVLLNDFVECYKEKFIWVLNELLESKHLQSIDEYDIISKTQYNQIINNWNNTFKPYELNKCIHQLFEEQAQLTPNEIAVIYENEKLSYSELNIESNQIAHYLLETGLVQARSLVVLCIDRSQYMLPVILAVFKSGAAYVPIEPNYPGNRIQHIVNDTNTNLIITTQPYKNDLVRLIKKNVKQDICIITIEEIQSKLSKQSTSNINNKISPDCLAYVIYTSGSTGIPKGVMIEHKSVVNRIKWMNELCPLTHTDRILQKTPYVFDVSVWELLWGIWYGACIVFAKPDGHKDAEYLADIIVKEDISIIHFVPSMLVGFEDYMQFRKPTLPSLKRVFCSGEVLNIKQVKEFKKLLPGVSIYNLFGPTEATVDVTFYDCMNDNDDVYIGKPISNTKIYVVNNNLQQLPIGVAGELCISGIGLARGYLNLPGETEQKFIQNPFQTEDERALCINSRLYKTGDLARFLFDGNLEYLGRQDNQVKLKGYRIELGEIESLVNSNSQVKQSVAVIRKYIDDETNTLYDNKYIAVYYTSFSHSHQDSVNKYISNWQLVYQNIYKNMDSSTSENNFIGWNSSYTDMPIELLHMEEWLLNTATHIYQLAPFNILEIGSGSGAIMLSCITYCNYYYATDFSVQSTNHLQKLVYKKDIQNIAQVMNCKAHEIQFDKINLPIDTIVLNSVIQYFPGTEYLQQLIRQLIVNLNGLAKIFIGDIRDYRLFDAFHYSVLYYKHKVVKQREIEFYKNREKELLVSPRYFIELLEYIPEIEYIEFLIKECDYLNELTQFRYDVVIHIKSSCFSQTKQYNEVRQDQFAMVTDINGFLENNKSEKILLVKYPYKNSYTEYIKYRNFNHGLELSQNIYPKGILSIGQIKELSKLYNFQCKFYLDIDDCGYLNLIFYRLSSDALFKITYNSVAGTEIQLNNNPAKSVELLESGLSNKIKCYLEKYLPVFMMPDAIIHVDTFPVTVNGKLDIDLLPEPEAIITKDYVAPGNLTESKICSAFAKVLSTSENHVGANCNFFKAGGNSVLAIKLVIELQHNFKINVADVFLHKSPSELAKHIILKENHLFKQLQQIKMLYANKNNSCIIDPKVLHKREEYLRQSYSFTFEQQKKCIRAVVLTGATGHVGCNILYQLISQTSYKIYLLVRSNTQFNASTRINSKFKHYFGHTLEKYQDRVIVFEANIEEMDLGLNAIQYEELVKEADSIIHAAGHVKYYGEYEIFYKSNIKTTINLLELAKLTKLKDFHYMSTIGIFMDGYIPGVEYYEFNEGDSPEKLVNHSNLYTTTKYQGELEIQKYKNLGVSANIYRLGNTAMDSSSYKHQENLDDNAFFVLISTIAKLGVIAPELDEMEISPVDYVTLSIVRIFDQEFLSNQTYHIVNTNFCKLSEMMNYKQTCIKICDISEFIDKILLKLKTDSTYSEQISLFMLHQLWLKELDTKNITTIKILNNKTNYILNMLNVNPPIVTPIMVNSLFMINGF